MAKVLVGVTGSVAAVYTKELFDQLGQAGHEVKIVATRASLYFFDPINLNPLPGSPPRRNPATVIVDDDEWPGLGEGRRYQRGEPVLHIELRRWADLLLIAPLDANTLAKLAYGLADNCLTCVARAWERTRPMVLAPAMNTLMWEHPATLRHFRQLATDAGWDPGPAKLDLRELLDWINAHCPTLRVVPPVCKRLACDEVGMGAMAGHAEILGVVKQFRA